MGPKSANVSPSSSPSESERHRNVRKLQRRPCGGPGAPVSRMHAPGTGSARSGPGGGGGTGRTSATAASDALSAAVSGAVCVNATRSLHLHLLTCLHLRHGLPPSRPPPAPLLLLDAVPPSPAALDKGNAVWVVVCVWRVGGSAWRERRARAGRAGNGHPATSILVPLRLGRPLAHLLLLLVAKPGPLALQFCAASGPSTRHLQQSSPRRLPPARPAGSERQTPRGCRSTAPVETAPAAAALCQRGDGLLAGDQNPQT